MPKRAFYDDRFFNSQMDQSYNSARKILGHLWSFYQPSSVADIGCGRGTWLKAAHELGARRLLGFDGEWNAQDKMIDPSISFVGIDLNKPLAIGEKVDLCLSLEVAEHIEERSAGPFVSSLTQIADVILFSAAFSGQGGHGHLNEQPHSYWGKLFADRGFDAFDLFRPVHWTDKDICFWYRQNSFLYVKGGHLLQEKLTKCGVRKLTDPGFMDCIHPEMYGMHYPVSFLMHVQALYPAFVAAMKRRVTQRPQARP